MNSLQHKWNQILETCNLTSPAKRCVVKPEHQACLSLAYSSFRTFKSMLRRGYDLFWIDTDGDDSPFAGAPKKLLIPPAQRPRSPFIVLDSLGEILRNHVSYKIDWNGFNGHSRKRGWSRLSDGSLVSAIPQTR